MRPLFLGIFPLASRANEILDKLPFSHQNNPKNRALRTESFQSFAGFSNHLASHLAVNFKTPPKNADNPPDNCLPRTHLAVWLDFEVLHPV